MNLLSEHEHMHAALQFVSGLGPRKAKRLLSKIKGLGKKIATRGDIFKSQLLTRYVYMSANAFMKIKIREEHSGGVKQNFDPLD